MNRRPALMGALLALALGCAACTGSASPRHTSPVSSPQSNTHSTDSSTTGTTSSPGTTPPATTSPMKTATTPPAGAVAADWASHVDFKAVQRTDMDCAIAQEGGTVEVTKVVSADVTGDGTPEAIVRVNCLHSASEWPDWVFVYSDATGTPRVLGTLITGNDSTYVPGISASGRTIKLGLLTWSKYAAGCCADLHYTQAFSARAVFRWVRSGVSWG
jgi:hypothetical protein